MPNDESTRRDFVKQTGIVAGGAALGAALGSGGDAEAHVVEINALNPTPEQIRGFLALDHDGPVVMVNLLKFKSNGGAVEYAKYGAAVRPIVEKLGGRILFSGQAAFCFLGNADWDSVALVEYPTKETLLQMVQSPEYQAIHHHREAGLEGQVNYAVIQTPF